MIECVVCGDEFEPEDCVAFYGDDQGLCEGCASGGAW